MLGKIIIRLLRKKLDDPSVKAYQFTNKVSLVKFKKPTQDYQNIKLFKKALVTM